MSKTAAVVVLLRRRPDRFLVIRRGPEASSSGYWAPLSGRMEPGETQAQTVVREVREEIGVTVSASAKIWECDTDDGAYRLHWWTAELAVADDELVLDPGEVSDARWVTSAEYFDLEPTFAGDREFFAEVFPTLPFPAI